MIFMTHPEHGATHVLQAEVEAHEQAGWKVDTYENWLGAKRVATATFTVPAEAKRKPGRPRKEPK